MCLPSVTACCALTVLPYSFLFVLFCLCPLRFLILPPLYSLFLFYFYLFFISLHLRAAKQTKQISCTLVAPKVLPAHISVNRKQEQAETRSHPRCCLPHLPTVYPFSNQIPPSHGCPNGTTFKLHSVEIPTKCSFVIEFIIPKFIEGSTCFEWQTAHHREL